jgi:DNA-binding MarR family transcriptional regulator
MASKLQSPTGSASTGVATPRGCTNFKLRQITRRVTRQYDAMVAGTGLKTTQYSLLSNVFRSGPVRPADLAATMDMDASTLTRNLQPLMARGWIEQGPGENGRSRLVWLTEDGIAKYTQARKAWNQAQLAFNQRLGNERVIRLHGLLDECMALLGDPGDEEPHEGAHDA